MFKKKVNKPITEFIGDAVMGRGLSLKKEVTDWSSVKAAVGSVAAAAAAGAVVVVAEVTASKEAMSRAEAQAARARGARK